ncbi:MAG TPA: hypothetical protein VGR70_20710 [Stellaceae bacterium]|nr:hypothetical protein [Stellaceae bacterium]
MPLKLFALAGATLALCAAIDPMPVAAQAVNCADMYGRVMALYQAAPLSPAYNQMAAAYSASCLAGTSATPLYMQTYVQAPYYQPYSYYPPSYYGYADYPYYGGYGYGFPFASGLGFGFGRGFHHGEFHGGSFHGGHHR